MLVFKRQKDESFMIGDDVEVTIVGISGDKVCVGVTAPKSIPVHRTEIWNKIQKEKGDSNGVVANLPSPTH